MHEDERDEDVARPGTLLDGLDVLAELAPVRAVQLALDLADAHQHPRPVLVDRTLEQAQAAPDVAQQPRDRLAPERARARESRDQLDAVLADLREPVETGGHRLCCTQRRYRPLVASAAAHRRDAAVVDAHLEVVGVSLALDDVLPRRDGGRVEQELETSHLRLGLGQQQVEVVTDALRQVHRSVEESEVDGDLALRAGGDALGDRAHAARPEGR